MTDWMISLGQTKIPESWHKSRTEIVEELPYVKKIRPSRGGERFNWDSVNNGMKRLRRVIVIILKSGGRVTAKNGYDILAERNIKFLPITVYGIRMSEARFTYYFNKIRSELNVIDPRRYRINFIKQNYLEISIEDLAAHLNTTPDYIKQAIRRMNKKGIK